MATQTTNTVKPVVPVTPDKAQLETAIKSGNFSAEQAKQYNQMIGNQDAARNLMLGSQKAVSNPNVQTAITTNEAQTMKNEGIKSVNPNITRNDGKTVKPVEQTTPLAPVNPATQKATEQGSLQQQTQPETTKTTVTQQNTPTGTVTTTETPKPQNIEKITTIDQFKQKGANVNNLEQFIEDRYGTTAQIQGNGVVANINGENFKWTIDNAGNPIKTSLGKGEAVQPVNLTSQDYLNQLNAGQKIQANNPAAIEAQHIYDSVGKYKGASTDVLYSDMVSGKIVPGSDNYNHLVQMNGGETPDMLQAKAKYQQKVKTDLINKNVDIQANDYTEPKNPVQTASDNLVKTKGMDYAQEFQKDIVENPDIMNLSKDLNDTNAQIKDLEYQKRKTLDNIIKDHPGISMGMAIGIANNINGDIDDQLFGLYNKQATQQSNLEYKTNLASKMFDYKIQQNQQDIAAAQKELDYQRGLVATTEQRQYEAAQQAQQTAQAFANQKELLALQQQYKDADIATSVITDQATGKQSLINSKTGEVIKTYDTGLKEATTESWAKLDDTTLYNQKTGETKTVNQIKNNPIDLLSVPDGTVVPGKYGVSDTMSQPGMQCGEYVNKITGIGVGDTLQSKLSKMTNKATNSYEPVAGQVGDVAVWIPDPTNKTFSKYGHTGIIVGEDGNNWLIKSSNIHGDGAITTDSVPKQEIMGTTGNYDKSKLQPTNEPLTDKQFTQSNQVITSFKSDPQVKSFEEAYAKGLNLISSLQTKTGPGDVAAIYSFMKSLDPQSVVREGEFDMAAKSAGVVAYLGNTWDRLTKGKKLTDSQAEAFGKLAKEYIKNQSTIYDIKYQDGLNRLKKQGIDTSVFPQNIADEMRKQLESGKQQQNSYNVTASNGKPLNDYFK